MNKLLFVVVFSATALLLRPMHASESEVPAEGLVTIALESVNLVDVLKVFARMGDANIQYNDRDINEADKVSINLTNEPWRPALQALLAERGLVLLAEPGGRNSYSIIKADKPDMAVRIQYASAAVSLADQVLADIKSNNVAAATARLQTFADRNHQIIKAFEVSQGKSQQGSANITSEPSVAPAPQVQR